jgi:hypothetical protein
MIIVRVEGIHTINHTLCESFVCSQFDHRYGWWKLAEFRTVFRRHNVNKV